MTPWAARVDPARVHPEYPRPQMVRPQWVNLNGLWQFARAVEGEPPPVGRELPGRILVPFPVESALSGVMEPAERLWYRRTFERPAGRRVLLHFEAVDWLATVWVNGQKVGEHRGGYDPFSFDVTDALRPDDPQELIVGVFDPTDNGDQPRGKQVRKPEGIWYTPCTGIWQTVWLEPVPQPVHAHKFEYELKRLEFPYIEDLKIEADAHTGKLLVTVHVAYPSAPDPGPGVPEARRIEAPASVEVFEAVDPVDRGWALPIASASRAAPGTIELTIPNPRLWSPDEPVLYGLRVELFTDRWRRARLIWDRVESYFGFRSVAVGTDENGARRLMLNGKPLFQVGPLDQGYWPDGIYTAPSDEALRYDIEMTRRLGFHMTRKHVKVEPRRWYTWADRLGLLVWQDMPSGRNAAPGSHEQFEHELVRMIETHRNHPSIIQWIIFNEGWGQFDTERLTARVKQLDPTRIVCSASGWVDHGCGDVLDVHTYPAPQPPPPASQRAAVLGEFGGLGLALPDHLWEDKHWGYQPAQDRADLTAQYELLLRRVYELRDSHALSAAVYTQLTDVEIECNGLLTYDRKVIKPDAARIAAANRGDFSSAATPDAKDGRGEP